MRGVDIYTPCDNPIFQGITLQQKSSNPATRREVKPPCRPAFPCLGEFDKLTKGTTTKAFFQVQFQQLHPRVGVPSQQPHWPDSCNGLLPFHLNARTLAEQGTLQLSADQKSCQTTMGAWVRAMNKLAHIHKKRRESSCPGNRQTQRKHTMGFPFSDCVLGRLASNLGTLW